MTPIIPIISSITRLGRVPVPHTNEATYALDAAGRGWVAKREADMGCEALLAEALTWLLARHVGVPVPDGAFCDDPSERAWLSSWVTQAKHWSAGSAGPIRNPDAAATILALDAVIFNEARHGGNILLVADAEGGSTVLAIDADEALIGHPAELSRRGLAIPDPRILAHRFPPHNWFIPALKAAGRIAAVPGGLLRIMAEHACAIAREPDVDTVALVLDQRCRAAHDLTRRYLALVEQRS